MHAMEIVLYIGIPHLQ